MKMHPRVTAALTTALAALIVLTGCTAGGKPATLDTSQDAQLFRFCVAQIMDLTSMTPSGATRPATWHPERFSDCEDPKRPGKVAPGPLLKDSLLAEMKGTSEGGGWENFDYSAFRTPDGARKLIRYFKDQGFGPQQ